MNNVFQQRIGNRSGLSFTGKSETIGPFHSRNHKTGHVCNYKTDSDFFQNAREWYSSGFNQ